MSDSDTSQGWACYGKVDFRMRRDPGANGFIDRVSRANRAYAGGGRRSLNRGAHQVGDNGRKSTEIGLTTAHQIRQEGGGGGKSPARGTAGPRL